MHTFQTREKVLAGSTLVMGLVLLSGLAFTAWGEDPYKNSYALLADAFLHGRVWVEGCYDIDCAVFEGRTYIVFPPAPALVVLPFVALFGTGFAGFTWIALAFYCASLVLWWRILRHLLPGEGMKAVWLLLAIGLATPLYFVTIRSSGVWFFAQNVAFLFVSLALYAAIVRHWPVWAGVALGLAFLCRQMSVFYLVFLFALMLDRDEPLIRIDRRHIVLALRIGLPVAAAVLAYLVYNYARFGVFLSAGYETISVKEGTDAMTKLRLVEHGLFSSAYLVFNSLYLFVQGFHFSFGGASGLEPGLVDAAGTSLLAASPFVLYTFFAPGRRVVWVGFATILFMAVPILFYHSNGFSQFNVQRYALDWLPILLIILALTLRRGRFEAFGLFVAFGVGLNAVTMALLTLYH